MPLFLVQDDDRPMYVVAVNWQEALKGWKEFIQKEEEYDDEEMTDVEPTGIQLLAPDDELIIVYLSEFTPSDTQQGEPGVSLADGEWEPAKGTFETKDPSCKDPWHTAQRRETESCPSCGFEPEVYKRLRESGAWEKSGINDPPTNSHDPNNTDCPRNNKRNQTICTCGDWFIGNKTGVPVNSPTCGGVAPPNPRASETYMRSSDDPPINSAVKCPNCDSMSYYTDGHHQLICSVCQYITPPLK